MIQRYDPESVKDHLGFRIRSGMDRRSTGDYVRFLDYSDLRTQLETALRWIKKIDPSGLDDANLSDFDADISEIEDFVAETYE